jgi:hypothetical protein
MLFDKEKFIRFIKRLDVDKIDVNVLRMCYSDFDKLERHKSLDENDIINIANWDSDTKGKEVITIMMETSLDR